MSDAKIGYGARFLTRYPDSPDTYVEWGEVTGITPPNLSRDSVDVSHMQSPNRHREFIPGMIDPGEVTIEFNLIPGGTTHAEILGELENVNPMSRRVVFSNGSIFEFIAFVTNVEFEMPIDDKMMGTATFKVTGEPVGLS